MASKKRSRESVNGTHANAKYITANPQKKAVANAGQFAEKIKQYLSSHKAPPSDIKLFGDALGYGRLADTMLASDLVLRRRAGKFLSSELRRLAAARPELVFHFWTFVHSRGHTSDRAPEIDLKFVTSSVDRVFRKHKLDAIYVVEVQGIGNYPANGEGRTIVTHVHALQWATPALDVEAICRRLNNESSWSNEFGAPAVKVKYVGSSEKDIAYLAYYLVKPPYDVKMVEDRKNGQRLKATTKGYRPDFAVRILELLSQLKLEELIRASGRGKDVKKVLLRRLKFWHRSRAQWAPGNLPSYYFDSLWDKYRTKKKRQSHLPFRIKR